MKKFLRIIVLLLAITTLVGCGKQEEKVNPVKAQEERKAEEKAACLKLVKEAYKVYEEKGVGPFTQAICRRSNISTQIYFEDKDHHIHYTSAFKNTSTNEEKLNYYYEHNNSIPYDNGLCEDEESLGALDGAICTLSKYARENYDKYLENGKNEVVELEDYFYFLFKESEFK